MAKVFSASNGNTKPACAEYADIDFTGFTPFTVAGWMKSTQNVAASVLVAKWDTFGQYIIDYISKKIFFEVRDTSVNRSVGSASDYNTDVWTHFAGVFDGSTIKLKINAGVTEDVAGPTVTTGISPTSNSFKIGNFSETDPAANRYAGSLAHVCVFNRALTNNELKSVMRRGPQSVPGCTLWFPCMSADVAEVNLGSSSLKTAVGGSTASFTMDTTNPPTGLMFGCDLEIAFPSPNPALTVSASDTLSMSDALSVGYGVTGLGVSDTLSMSDALALGWGIRVSDTLNNWSDTFTFTYSNFAQPLSVTINDRFSRNGNPGEGNLTLRDGLAFVLTPEGPIGIHIDDLGAFFDDGLKIGYGLAISDTLNNWNDAFSTWHGYVVEAFDSMFYNLFDAVSLTLTGQTGGGTASDQLVMSDGVSLTLSGALEIGDSLSLADEIAVKLSPIMGFSDQMVMSDSIQLLLHGRISVSDTLSMSDGFTKTSNTDLSRSVSDSLNNWADAIDVLSSTAETAYLRQYLNDVIN